MLVRLKNKEYREMFNALGVEHIDLAFVEYNSEESELLLFINKQSLISLLERNNTIFEHTIQVSLRRPTIEDDKKIKIWLENFLQLGKRNHGATYSAQTFLKGLTQMNNRILKKYYAFENVDFTEFYQYERDNMDERREGY